MSVEVSFSNEKSYYQNGSSLELINDNINTSYVYKIEGLSTFFNIQEHLFHYKIRYKFKYGVGKRLVRIDSLIYWLTLKHQKKNKLCK